MSVSQNNQEHGCIERSRHADLDASDHHLQHAGESNNLSGAAELVEEKDDMGNIKSDEPERSSVLGTAKSNIENSPSIPAQYLVTFKVSGPAAVLELSLIHISEPTRPY